MIAVRTLVVFCLLILGFTQATSQAYFSAPGNNAMHVANDDAIVLTFSGVLDTTRTGLTMCRLRNGNLSPSGCKEPAFIVIDQYHFDNTHDSLWDDYAVTGQYSITGNSVTFASNMLDHSTKYVAISRNLWSIDTTTSDTTHNTPDTVAFRIEHPVPDLREVTYSSPTKGYLGCLDTVRVAFTSTLYNQWSGIDTLVYVASLELDSSTSTNSYYSDSALVCDYSISSDSTMLFITHDSQWPTHLDIGFVFNKQFLTGITDDRVVQPLRADPYYEITIIALRNDSIQLPMFTTDTILSNRFLGVGDSMSIRAPETIGDYSFVRYQSASITSLNNLTTRDTSYVVNSCSAVPIGSHMVYASYSRREGQFVTILDSASAVTMVSHDDVQTGSGTYFLASDAQSKSTLYLSVTPPNGYHFVKWISNHPAYNNLTTQFIRLGDIFNVNYRNWWIRPDIGQDPNPGCQGPYTICVKNATQGYFFEFSDGGLTAADIIEYVEIDGVRTNCLTVQAPGQYNVTIKLKDQYLDCYYISFMGFGIGYRAYTTGTPIQYGFQVNVGPPNCQHDLYINIARTYKFLEVEISDIDNESVPEDYKLRFSPYPLTEQSYESKYGYFNYQYREVQQGRIMHRVKYYCNQIVDIMPSYRDGIPPTDPYREPPYNGTSFKNWDCGTSYHCPPNPSHKWIMNHVMDQHYTLTNAKRTKHKVQRDFVLEAIGVVSNSNQRGVISKWYYGPLFGNIPSLLSNSSMSLGTSHIQLLFSKPVSSNSLENGNNSRITAKDRTRRLSDCDMRDKVEVTYKAQPSRDNCDLLSGNRIVDWFLKESVTIGGVQTEKRTPKTLEYQITIAEDLQSTNNATISKIGNNLKLTVHTEPAKLDLFIEAVGYEDADDGENLEGSALVIAQKRSGNTIVDADVLLLPQVYSQTLRDNLENDNLITAAQREFTLNEEAPGNIAVNSPLHIFYQIPELRLYSSLPDFHLVLGIIDINLLCEDMLDNEHWPGIKSTLINMWSNDATAKHEPTIKYLRENTQSCLFGADEDEVVAFSNNISSQNSLSNTYYGISTSCNPSLFQSTTAYVRNKSIAGPDYFFLRLKAVAN